MIKFNGRLSCIISSPKHKELTQAFHHYLENLEINETYNSPQNGLTLIDGKTIEELFQKDIQDFANQYGISLNDIVIEKYTAESHHEHIVVCFYNGNEENLFETKNGQMKVVAYYREKKEKNYGLELKDYSSHLSNHTYRLRLGKEVPEGDVNLAYIHTPRVNVDHNVGLIDTSSQSENIIPFEQQESIVVADRNGKLHYANLLDPPYMPIVLKPPYDMFPSKRFSLTNRFDGNVYETSHALYYKFEIKYHYDSKAGEPGKVVRYKGNQIRLTDEYGHPLDDRYRYIIYARAMEGNPHIYWIKIYIQVNTTKTETFKVQYNHVDDVFDQDEIQSVKRTVELYSNRYHENMVEGGKLRILNGVSVYQEVTESDLSKADENEEVYAIKEDPGKDGYQIYVPMKAEPDPREKTIFNYKLSMRYHEDGEEKIVSFGYVTDWVINEEALLEHEKPDYKDGRKVLYIDAGRGHMRAEDFIRMVLPPGLDNIPPDAEFFIEDAQGNLLYTTKSASDNPNVDTFVDTSGFSPPYARARKTTQKWEKATLPSRRIKGDPIPHICTIFPEKQLREKAFTFEAVGEGLVEEQLSYTGEWKGKATFYVLNESTGKRLNNFSNWKNIGYNTSLEDWQYNSATDTLTLTHDFYENSTFYDNSPSAYQMRNYAFQSIIEIPDDVDGDLIGLVFRFKNPEQHYIFAWEREYLTTEFIYEGDRVIPPNRILMDERGISQVRFRQDVYDNVPGYNYTEDPNDYRNNYGFKWNKKRIFKASKSNKADFNINDPLNPNTRHARDLSHLSFTDITEYNSNYNRYGWEPYTKYKVTILCVENHFQVYITTDINSNSIGTLVCEAYDNSYSTGSYGFFNVSQRRVQWSNNKIMGIEVHSVESDPQYYTFSHQSEVRISNQTIDNLMKPYIENHIRNNLGTLYPYLVTEYSTVNGPYMQTRIGSDKYVYGRTTHSDAGRIIHVPWRTSDHGRNLKGSGVVHFTGCGGVDYVEINPNPLHRNNIPSHVFNFQWKYIYFTSDMPDSTISIGPNDTVIVTTNMVPIEPVGKPYTIKQDYIYKQDGIKTLLNLQDIWDELQVNNVDIGQLLLRIERGDINGNNKEFRVNYRFGHYLDNTLKFELDYCFDWINRMRFNHLMDIATENNRLTKPIYLMAWTTFEDLEAVPIFAIKMEEDRKIVLEKPIVQDETREWDNWYVRVKDGKMKKRIRLPYFEPQEKVPQIYVSYPELLSYAPKKPEDEVEVILNYTIPEYTNQNFHYRPIMLVDREKPKILNETTIQTHYAPIVLSSDLGISYLEVEAIRANHARKLRISDVDAQKGIIYLHDRIRDQDEVIVRYAYYEHWYTYRGFNRNHPVTNASQFFHLDVNPTPGHRYTVAKRSIMEWIPGDVKTSANYSLEHKPSNELLAKEIHVYLRPTSIWIPDEDTPIPGTVRPAAIYHTDEGYWFDPNDYYYDPTMYRLGKILIQPHADFQRDTIIIDTRTRGGGIDERISKEIIKRVNQETLYHWDIGYFDGEAYQENGVFIVRLPRTLLKEYGGQFSEAEIQEAVAKYKAYGTLPIIEFYDESEEENLLRNASFQYGEHIREYSAELSQGQYVIKKADATSYHLVIQPNAQYVIQIPGYRLKAGTYQLEIQTNTRASRIGRIEIEGENLETIILNNSQQNTSWKRLQYEFELEPPEQDPESKARPDTVIKQLKIVLNPSTEAEIDFVILKPVVHIDGTTTEIVNL